MSPPWERSACARLRPCNRSICAASARFRDRNHVCATALARYLGRFDFRLSTRDTAVAIQAGVLISSSGTMRPCSKSSSSILPGCSRPLYSISSASNGSTPASEAITRQASFCDQITRWPKPISIERCPDHPAISKRNGGRTVPGLHERCMILVESSLFIRHAWVRIPCFGNQHCHRMRERTSRHGSTIQLHCRVQPNRSHLLE